MATQSTYYLDAPSFGSATIIYSDVNLTIVAPDGFYSDGTIVREQVSGVLLPQTSCPGCAVPCGGSIAASGSQGIYYLNTDLGTDTGAVIVTFDPYSVPDGILANFNSTLYNALVSPVFGFLQGTVGQATYIGDTSANCGVPAGSPYTLDEYNFDGTNFVSMGTTTSVPINSGQLQFSAGAPGNCVMVIPKTSASPSILSLQFIGPCAGTAFGIGVSCPAALTSFDSSSVVVSDTLACAATINQTYYVAHVNGAAGVLGLYDLVFSDPNGEFKLNAGYYRTNDAGSNDWFQVDANGIITAFGTCTTPPLTARIDWNVGNQSGGQLIIYDNTMTEKLNVTSSAGSSQSGTIYIADDKLPYTIRGRWVSGSGNIIRYNVCDIVDDTTMFNSGPIDIVITEVDYAPSPTPIHVLVQLRANNVTPPICPVL